MTTAVKAVLQCSVTLKHKLGVASGSALWIDGDRILFEADARIEDGEVCEMRLARRGHKETVYAEVAVALLPHREGETPRFAGRILTLEGEDKKRLER